MTDIENLKSLHKNITDETNKILSEIANKTLNSDDKKSQYKQILSDLKNKLNDFKKNIITNDDGTIKQKSEIIIENIPYFNIFNESNDLIKNTLQKIFQQNIRAMYDLKWKNTLSSDEFAGVDISEFKGVDMDEYNDKGWKMSGDKLEYKDKDGDYKEYDMGNYYTTHIDSCYNTYASTDDDKCYEISNALLKSEDINKESIENIIKIFDDGSFVWGPKQQKNINNIPPPVAKQILKKFGFEVETATGNVQNINSWKSNMGKGIKIADGLLTYLNMLVFIVNKFLKTVKTPSTKTNSSTTTTYVNAPTNTPGWITSRNIKWAPKWSMKSSTDSDESNWNNIIKNINKTYGTFSRGLDLKNMPFDNVNPKVRFELNFPMHGGSTEEDSERKDLTNFLNNQESKLACTSGISKVMRTLIAKMKSSGYVLDNNEIKVLNEKLQKLDESEKAIQKIAQDVMKYTQIMNYRGEHGNSTNPDEISKSKMLATIDKYYTTMTDYDRRSTSIHSIIPLLEKLINNAVTDSRKPKFTPL
jgi:hypothetical protein